MRKNLVHYQLEIAGAISAVEVDVDVADELT
jgi:hypothetical protein